MERIAYTIGFDTVGLRERGNWHACHPKVAGFKGEKTRAATTRVFSGGRVYTID